MSSPVPDSTTEFYDGRPVRTAAESVGVERPMRLLLLCRVLWTAGTQEIAIDQLRSLSRLGLSCELVFLRTSLGAGQLLAGLTGEPVVVLRSGSGRLLPIWGFLTNWAHGTVGTGAYTAEAGLDFGALVDGARYVLRARPDLVIAHDQYSGISAYLCWKLARIPYIVYVHESLPEDPNRMLGHLSSQGSVRLKRLSSLLDGPVLSAASHIFCNTRGTKESVERSVPGITSAEVLYPGFRSSDIVTDGTNRSVLSVSTWDKGRHPDLYLGVSRRLKGTSVILAGAWRYGNVSDRRDFEQTASEDIASGRLVVTGPISQAELDTYYRHARVFLRFGVEESGPGMGAMRALAAGIPVVANSQLGIADVLSRYDCGIVIGRPDPELATDALTRLLDDASLWKSMHSAALRAAEENAWSKHAARIQEVARAVTNQLASDGAHTR